MSEIKALVFDVFGTVVDWRTSLIDNFTAWAAKKGIKGDWTALVDGWRAAYMPSMDEVRKRPESDFVILDEAHYLADEERGHVWEESIILSPPRIRLLLLSATVGRAGEFAAWIEEIRGTKVRVVKAGPRPVELRAGYISSDLQLFPLFGEDGGYNRDLDQFAKQRSSGFRRRRY